MRGRAKGPGRLWKRGGQWVLDYTDERGERHRRSLSTSRKEAELIRADLIRKRDMTTAGLGSEVGQGLLLSEICDGYLADLRGRVTTMHYRNVSQRLQRTIPKLGSLRVQDLKAMHVIRLRSEELAAGKSHRTANLVATTIQALLRWAVENELIMRSPIDRVKRLPETEEHLRCRRRAMSDQEITRFLDAAEADDAENALRWSYTRVPQVPLWRALLETGARWNELRLTRWGDVDLAGESLVLRAENTKTRRMRVIPLTPSLTATLRSLKVLHQAVLGRLPSVQDFIFLSPEGEPWLKYTTNCMRIFDRLLERAKIAKVDVTGAKLDLHALRHTAGTRLVRVGVSIVHAQKLLGHADPKTTARIYAHLEVEDLRAAVRAAGSVSPSRQLKEAAQ